MQAACLSNIQEPQDTERRGKASGQPVLRTPVSLASAYHFEHILGHGGQANVYLAERLSDHRHVVIKQLNIGSVKAWKEYELFHR